MLSTLILTAALGSTCGSSCADSVLLESQSVVVSRPTIIRHSQPLFLVGQYQFANRELIAEIRALRSALAARGMGSSRSSSVLSLTCGGCHTGESAKGSFDVDSMSSEDKLNAIRQMATGSMPPERTLDRETKNQLLAELTSVDVDEIPPDPRNEEPVE